MWPPNKGYIGYKVQPNESILLKTSLSGVSIEGALKNLTELPHWNFEKAKKNAQTEWNKYLSRIEVESSDLNAKKIFYTALYHALVVPNLYMDVDGRYRGVDKQVHQARNFKYYSNFSLWDTFRAAHPLYNLIAQTQSVDFVNSMLAMSQQNPQGFMPVWPLQSDETFCMIGCHSISVISDAIMKNMPGIDVQLAYQLMKKQVQNKEFKDQGYYLNYGYCPYDLTGSSVSTTLEYAYNEWCVAQVARKLGFSDDYKYFMNRSENFKNLFDPGIKWMRPRRSDGTWLTPCHPDDTEHFTEANTWQYTWSVQHNPSFLIDMMGGNINYFVKLDSIFKHQLKANELAADMSGRIGAYVHGNEPSHHIAYMFNYAGAWQMTQSRVKQIRNELYSSKPDGLCGNDDLGQMSAWYVFSALGFYPVNPTSNEYALGISAFKKITLHLSSGKQLIIKNNPKANEAIIAAFNNQVLKKPFLTYEKIQNGGVLIFK